MDEEFLSAGTLTNIVSTRETSVRPTVQLLFVKPLGNNKHRAVFSDGEGLLQNCILFSASIDKIYNQLEKFTIVKLLKYTVMTIRESDVLMVNDLQILKPGNEVNRRVMRGERYTRPPGSQQQFPSNVAGSSSSTAAASTSASTSSRLQPTRQPVKSKGVLMGSPPGGTLRNQDYCDINVLTPYFTSHVLKCKVKTKSPLRTYSNAKGEGRLFTFEVCDNTASLKITAFNEHCDQLLPLIEPDQSLLISRLKIAVANKRFTSNEYDATVQSNTIIEATPDLDDTIGEPAVEYRFKYLSDVAKLPEATLIDVIGVINTVGERVEFNSKKANRPMTRREFTLVDKSMAQVCITLWGQEAIDFAGREGQVLSAKNVRIKAYQGKTLTTINDTTLALEPDLPEAQELRTWWDQGAKNLTNFQRLSGSSGTGSVTPGGNNGNTYISQLNSIKLEAGDKARVYYNLMAMIIATNSTSRHIYKACKRCRKKLQVDNDGGILHCSKCHTTTTEYTPGLLLALNVTDSTGQLWVTLFQEGAEKLLGKSTEELAQIYDTGEEHYSALLDQIRFKTYQFRISAGLSEYHSEARIRCMAYTAVSLKPAEEHSKLVYSINVLKDQLAA